MPALSAPPRNDQLARQLGADLLAAGFDLESLTLRCVALRGKLMVLAEHPSSLAVEPGPVLSALQQSLEQHLPLGLPETVATKPTLPVEIFLRRSGQKQPYAQQAFVWQPGDMLTTLFDGDASAAAKVAEADDVPDAGEASEVGDAAESAAGAEVPAVGEGSTAVSRDAVSALALRDVPEETLDSPAEEEDGEAAGGAIAPLSPKSQPGSVLPDAVPPWMRFPLWSLGIAAGILLLGTTAYGLTRPCVVGGCRRLDRAAQLSQQAARQVAEDPSVAEVQQAHDRLSYSIASLVAIPRWSRFYRQAQADLAQYQTEIADLDQIIRAQQRAYEAVQVGQDPPHPLATWVEARLLWRQAVNLLDQVPSHSPIYPLAQTKRQQYSSNLDSINQRVETEQAAADALSAAIQTSQLAQRRHEDADSLSSWQLAHQDWQTAVNLLRRIPQGTTARREAAELLPVYQRQLIEARDRSAQEGIAEQTYRDAVRAASAAQAEEENNQWTRAVSHWRAALSRIEQVPQATRRHEEAQVLEQDYQARLTQAQQHLRSAMAMETIQGDLAALCGGSPAVCRHSFSRSHIRLDIVGTYDLALAQTITPPPQQLAITTAPDVQQRTNALVQGVSRIGHQVNLPVDLYGADGLLIARYRPELNGFVKQ
jgi:hypothetical protein